MSLARRPRQGSVPPSSSRATSDRSRPVVEPCTRRYLANSPSSMVWRSTRRRPRTGWCCTRRPGCSQWPRERLPAFGAGGVALRGIKSLLDCVDVDGCAVPPPCSSPLSCSLPGAGHRLQRKSAELLPDQAQNNKCRPYPHAVQQIGGNPSGSVAAVKPSPGRRPAGSAGFGDLRTSSHALAWLRRTGAATGTNDALATGHKRTATVHLGAKCCDTRNL